MDYTNDMARSYALFRTIDLGVLASLVEEAGLGARSRVLEAGCGCGNYVRALSTATGCAVSGLDPSEDMLGEARRLGGVAELVKGRAEEVARFFAPETFELGSAEAYERKSFSSLHLIRPEEFGRGLARLKADLSHGPIIANSAYSLVWGTNQ